MIDCYHGDLIADSDWDKLIDAGNDVFILKASEGANFVDPSFRERVGILSSKEGIRLGAYHVARGSSAASQVDNFLRACEGVKLDYFIVDIETDSPLGTAIQIADALQAQLTAPVILYANAARLWDVYNSAALMRLPHLRTMRNYAIWVAEYAPAFKVPDFFRRRVWAWQYTDSYRCPGVAAALDRSIIINADEVWPFT